MSMTDYARVLRVTERVREEYVRRLLGRGQDDRFDPIIDSLLDLADDLEAADGQATAGLAERAGGAQRPEDAAERAS